jgi:hypothetical protein
LPAGTPQQVVANPDTVTVQELIDVVAVWQDAANVQTPSPDIDRVLTFLVRNTGNGIETFSLGIDNSPNGNSMYDGPAVDPLYVPGGNDPVLDANGSDSITIFALNDIPAGRSDGDTGDSRLQVQSTTAGAYRCGRRQQQRGCGCHRQLPDSECSAGCRDNEIRTSHQ